MKTQRTPAMRGRRQPGSAGQARVGWILGATFVLGAAILSVAVAWWVGTTRARALDTDMRDRLMRQAEEISHTLNPGLAAELTFTAADRGTPAFEVMREQLIAHGKAIPCRGVYTVAQRGGRLYFGPENYAESDPQASPPGTEYKQPPAEFRAAFVRRKAITEGPATDEYGTFVSAVAPLLDPETGSVILVVGVDVLASDWEARLQEARRGPFVTAALVFLSVVGLVGAGWWNNQRRRATDLKLRVWIVGPLAAAIVIWLGYVVAQDFKLAREMSRWELQRLLQQVQSLEHRHVSNSVERLKTQQDLLDRDDRLRAAWVAGDGGALEVRRLALLAELQRQHQISVFDLRPVEPARRAAAPALVAPGRGGDSFALQTARRTGHDAWGEELDAQGRFAVHYVRPWLHENRVIGYLELAMETDHLIDVLARDLGVAIVVLLRRELAPANGPAAARPPSAAERAGGKPPPYWVAPRSRGELPADVIGQLEQAADDLGDRKYFTLRRGDDELTVGFLSLRDALGRNVGRLAVWREANVEAEAMNGWRSWGNMTVFISCLGVLALLWVVTGRAETQLAEAFAAVRDSEEKHRALFHASPDAYLLVTDGQIVDCNQAAEVMLRGDRSRIVGEALQRFAPTRQPNGRLSAETTSEHLSLTLQDGRHGFDQVQQRIDGTTFWAEVTMSRLTVGGHMAVIAAWRDISARREVEEKVRYLTRAVEQSPISIVITNPRGEIQYVNRKFAELTGYTQAEAIGQNPRILKSGRQGKEVYRELWMAVREGREWRGELHNRKKNGELYWESVSISAIRNSAGEITHYLAVKEDINERKRYQAELEQTNASLEEAIARAHAMTVSAEMASIAKSEFLARMSHEIRTPMNGVIGMTDLLLDTPLSEAQQKYAGIVRSSANALLEIVNDILDFSKIEARRLKFEAIDFDLRAMLGDALEVLAERAQGKQLELVGMLESDVPTALRADPGRLRQIVVNLLGNAIKFTERGEVVLRVRVEDDQENDVMLRFEVTDTGIGIPEDKLGGLFTAFTQVDGSTTRRYGGTGLGLAITKQLAELMGGEVGVRSVVGAGSTFWFTARLAKQPAAAPVREKRHGLPEVRILVVDDNSTNRQLVVGWIEGWGAQVSGVAGGAEALSHLVAAAEKSEPFALCLVDAVMPEMGGAELIKRIDTTPVLTGLKSVLMTPLGQPVGTAGLAAAGWSGAVAKPLRPEQLLRALRRALGCEGAGKAGEAARTAAAGRLSAEERSGFRILVVEDNPTNQLVSVGLLKNLGYRSEVAVDGYDALRKLAASHYDLVLMDCQMPELDGFETTRRIRQLEATHAHRRVPVIAMTADAMQGVRETCLEAGMDDYVAKPVSIKVLAAALDRWLGPEADRPDGSAGETAAAARPPPDFDQAGFMSRVMDDRRLAGVVLKGFLADMPQQISALRDFAVAGDVTRILNQAHLIKGAAATAGGDAMQATVVEVERRGQAGDLLGVADLVPQLESQFGAFRASVSELLRAPGDTR